MKALANRMYAAVNAGDPSRATLIDKEECSMSEDTGIAH
jgi:hypothetical protein